MSAAEIEFRPRDRVPVLERLAWGAWIAIGIVGVVGALVSAGLRN